MTIRYTITTAPHTGYTVSVQGRVVGTYLTYRKANAAAKKEAKVCQ